MNVDSFVTVDLREHVLEKGQFRVDLISRLDDFSYLSSIKTSTHVVRNFCGHSR